MSEYNIRIAEQPFTPLFSPDYVQEKRAARKKLLKTIFQRRREHFKQFIQRKRQLQPESDLL